MQVHREPIPVGEMVELNTDFTPFSPHDIGDAGVRASEPEGPAVYDVPVLEGGGARTAWSGWGAPVVTTTAFSGFDTRPGALESPHVRA